MVNFDDPNCQEFQGAKRDPQPKEPSLKQQDEECYVEGAYEDILEYELAESNAKLEELQRQLDEVKDEEPLKPNYPRIKDDLIILRTRISPRGVEILENDFPKDPEYSTKDECQDELGIKTQRHPNTVRSYTAVLLAFFSNLETEYVNKDGLIFTRKIPVFYATREKLVSIDQHEFENLSNGNTNILPRAAFSIDSMQYDSSRQLNKSLNVSAVVNFHTLSGDNPYAEVQAAPSPYLINCRLVLVTRGINDALMIAEQVGSFFNPFYDLPMFENGIESSVRLKLEGITFEPPTFDEFSQNEVITEFTFTLYGNLYKPTSKQYLAENINVNYLQ